MNAWTRRIVVGLLFAALALALLWFQGILGGEETPPAKIPGPPPLRATDRTATVERRSLPESRVFAGFVAAADVAEIAPQVMATVRAVSCREGDPVAAGQELAALEDRDARARRDQAAAVLEGAAATALASQLAFTRAERLHAAGALTTQELEAARAAHEAAQAEQRRAQDALDEAEAILSWYRVVAPFAGRVLDRLADPGDLALPGRALLTVYREERLRFQVAIPEERAGALASGAAAEIVFDGVGARAGTLATILPAADPRSGTVELRFDLAPDPALRPGALGRWSLPVGTRETLLAPAAAVERVGQLERVRLVRDGRVTIVAVRTGRTHGDAIEILSGLAAGETVLLP